MTENLIATNLDTVAANVADADISLRIDPHPYPHRSAQPPEDAADGRPPIRTGSVCSGSKLQ